MEYPDVQGSRPDIPLEIQKVGVKGVLYPIRIKRGSRDIPLYSTIDVFVDVPGNRKGADLSRTIESISHVTGQPGKTMGVEYLAEDIAENVLEKFPYSTRAQVHLEADYFAERELKDGKKHAVKYRIISDSVNTGKVASTSIGVVVYGINACPCAMETTRTMLVEDFPGNSEIIGRIPVITHNQRNRVTLIMQTDRKHQLEVDDLIDIAEKPVNGPLVSILKRQDEGRLVYDAHRTPRFVEDISREIARDLALRYPGFPDSFSIQVVSESEESIHPHNAFSEISTTFGEIRKDLGIKS